MTFIIAMDLMPIATSAQGVHRDLRHCLQLWLEGFAGTFSLTTDVAPPLLQLEGLAGTFGITSNVSLATTSARGARQDIRLHH
jgi:ferredoxin-NADP reductase